MAGKNARPRDARAGYTIYRDAGGRITRDALNERLITNGFGPISDRMMTHYRNLVRHRYDHYISINRFDVSRAAAPYDDLSASPRYRFAPANEGVTLLIAKGSRLWTAAGTVEHLSEAGALVRLVDEEYGDGLAEIKVQAGDQVSLRFLESGRSETGRLVEVDTVATPPLLEVQFRSLVSLADFAIGPAAPTTTLGTRLVSNDDDSQPTTDQLGRRLFLFFELVDEIRYIANLVSQSADDESRVYSPPATVERLSVASPAETILAVSELVKAAFPAGALTGVLIALTKIPEMRKTWFEGTGVDLDNQAKRAAAERDLMIEELTTRISEGVGLRAHEAAQSQHADIVDEAVRERLLPVLESLADAGVVRIEKISQDASGEPLKTSDDT